MKIGLVSEVFRNGDLEFNLAQIKGHLFECGKMGFDLICFGEAFLQGFDALIWDHSVDLPVAISQLHEVINSLRDSVPEHGVALSFGYLERDGETIYCSNLVISHTGEILNNFRRLSKGWKEPIADCNYREGTEFSIFTYKGKRFATAICGDLWHAKNIRAAEKLAIDCLLWPNYVDYSVEKWAGEMGEYARHVQGISAPVLLINSHVEQAERAKGGCCVFQNGEVVKGLQAGEIGVLVYEL